MDGRMIFRNKPIFSTDPDENPMKSCLITDAYSNSNW